MHEVIWRSIVVRNRAIVRADDGFCEQHAKLVWESYLSEDRQGSGDIYKVPGAACFELELLMDNRTGQPGRVLLREVGNKRLAFFPDDFSQAGQIYYSVHDSHYKELLVHLAIKRLAEQFGGVLSYVVMDQLNVAGYFEAHAIIVYNEKLGEIEHPSFRWVGFWLSWQMYLSWLPNMF